MERAHMSNYAPSADGITARQNVAKAADSWIPACRRKTERPTLQQALAIVAALSTICAALAVRNIRFTTDSLRSQAVAQQISAGRGLRLPGLNFATDKTLLDSAGTIAFVVQPPLYPPILALTGGGTPGGV